MKKLFSQIKNGYGVRTRRSLTEHRLADDLLLLKKQNSSLSSRYTVIYDPFTRYEAVMLFCPSNLTNPTDAYNSISSLASTSTTTII